MIIGNLIPAGTGLKPYRSRMDVKDADAEKIIALFGFKEAAAQATKSETEQDPEPEPAVTA